MAQIRFLLDNWLDDLLKVMGEIAIPSRQLEYALEPSIDRAAEKPFFLGKREAANLRGFRAKWRELERLIADGDHPDKEHAELTQFLEGAYRFFRSGLPQSRAYLH